MESFASFKISEDGRSGRLDIHVDHFEYQLKSRLGKKGAVRSIFFSDLLSATLGAGPARQDATIETRTDRIKLKVYGNAQQLVNWLNAGRAGELGPVQRQPERQGI